MLSAALLAYFWPLLIGRQMGQSHLLYFNYPWASGRPDGIPLPGNSQGDVALVFHPLLVMAREQLSSGQLPLWNPYIYAGFPLAGDLESGLLYPLMWLGLIFPANSSWGVIMVLKLLTAGAGTFVFARELGRSRRGSVLAAVIYMLAAPNLVWLQLPTATVVSLLPWTFLLTHRLHHAVRPRTVAWLAVVVALAIVAGHPESVASNSAASAVYLIGLAVFSPRRAEGRTAFRSRVTAWLSAHVLGASLSAIVLVPFGVAAIHSISADVHDRLHAPSGATALTYVLPTLFGDGSPDYFGSSFIIYDASYFGLIAALLGGVAFIRGRRDNVVRALAAVAVLALMVTYRIPPLTWVVDVLPVYKTLHWHVFSVVALAGALGAGAGFDSLSSRPLAWRKVAAYGMIVGLACGCGLVLAHLGHSLVAPAAVKRDALLRALLFGTIGLGFLAAVGRTRRGPTIVALLVAVSVDASYLYDYNAMLPPRKAHPPEPALIAWLARQPGPFRINPLETSKVNRTPNLLFPGVLPPDTSALYKIDSVTGYDYPQSRRWSDFSHFVLRQGGSREVVIPPPSTNRTSLTALRMMNVRYHVGDPGSPPPRRGFPVVYRGSDGVVYRDPDALPRAYVVSAARRASYGTALQTLEQGRLDPKREALVPPDTPRIPRGSGKYRAVRVTNVDEQHVKLSVPTGPAGWLVLANAYSSQWSATVDGRGVEVAPTNFAAMGIPIGAGQHEVRFAVRRNLYGIGAAISGLSLIILAVLFGLRGGFARRADRGASAV